MIFVSCGGEGAPESSSGRATPTIGVAVDTNGGTHTAFVVMQGFSQSQLDSLRALVQAEAALERDWHAWLRVTVVDDLTARDSLTGPIPAIVGRYAVSDSALAFHPRFAFDAGRTYRVEYAVGRLRVSGAIDSVAVTTFALPAHDQTARTYVSQIMPSGDVVSANLLRMYIEFSAPMSRTGGLEFISLRDEQDRVVPLAFLPLEADFWNRERTRYTAFFDPGRVKQGILPNEQMGRALIAGRRYSIVVDSAWRDANGVPLTASYRKSFRVGPVAERIVDTKLWQITAPKSNSTEALVVDFPTPLDHGLLVRSIGVSQRNGAPVTGTVAIAHGEQQWRFVPSTKWKRGQYQLVVLSILEDPAGNSVSRPFEVDVFERIDSLESPEKMFLAFVVR